jgi:hypothetical protein
MTDISFEEYLAKGLDQGITEHTLCNRRVPDGRMVFYIYPMFGAGDTLDFSVQGNHLTRLTEPPE